MTEKKVEAIFPNDVIGKQSLIEMAMNPELEHFMFVGIWKDGAHTTGWSSGMKSEALVYGAKVLDTSVDRVIFGG